MFDSAQAFLDHLIHVSDTGGFPSVGPDGKCRYRGENGRRCPVGFLIGDGVYLPEMDEGVDGMGYAAAELYSGPEFKLPLPAWAERGSQLEDVQNAHDVNILPGNGWSHTEFIHRLKKCPVFQGCRFPETSY